MDIQSQPGETLPMKDDTHRLPIGVFDSGVGGLTVLRERLPGEDSFPQPEQSFEMMNRLLGAILCSLSHN